MSDLTGDLLAAVVAATPERKQLALQALNGELPQALPRPLAEPLLLGMTAAARVLGVSRCTLWRMVRAGRIQKVELFRGSFRISRASLETFAAAPALPTNTGSLRATSRPRNRRAV